MKEYNLDQETIRKFSQERLLIGDKEYEISRHEINSTSGRFWKQYDKVIKATSYKDPLSLIGYNEFCYN